MKCTVLVLVTGITEDNLISVFALVEPGPGQAILMREPSRQWEQRTYGELLHFIRSRTTARAFIGSSALLTTGGRQASSSRATDQRAELTIISAKAAPTNWERGLGLPTTQTASGGEPFSPRHRRPSREHPGQSAGIGATASPTRSESDISDDVDAAESRKERETA